MRRKRIIALLIVAVFMLQTIFSNIGMSVLANPAFGEPGNPGIPTPPVAADAITMISLDADGDFNYKTAADGLVKFTVVADKLATRTVTEVDGNIEYSYTPVDISDINNIVSAIGITCKDKEDNAVTLTVDAPTYDVATSTFMGVLRLPDSVIDSENEYTVTINAYRYEDTPDGGITGGDVTGGAKTEVILVDSTPPIMSTPTIAEGFIVDGVLGTCYNGQKRPTVSFDITEKNLKSLAVQILDEANQVIASIDTNNGLTYDETSARYYCEIPELSYVTLKVRAEDKVGFVAEASPQADYRAVVDYTDAVIGDMVASDANTLDGVYYLLDNSKVSFSISDANFVKGRMSLGLYDEAKNKVTDVDLSTFAETIEGNTHYFSGIPVLPDGKKYFYRVTYGDISRVGSTEEYTSKDLIWMQKDNDLPTLSISANAESNSVTTEDVTIKISLKEANPDFSGIRSSLYARNNTKTLAGACKLRVGDSVIECASSTDLDATLQSVTSWEKDKDGYHTTLILSEEADYSFSLLATDALGNISNRIGYFVVVDKSAPSFSSVDIDATQDSSKNDYTRFSNKKITFDFVFKEKVTSVTEVACVYVDKDTNTSYTVQAKDIAQSKDKVTGTVSISNNFRGNVKLIAKDKAGHTTTYSIKGSMILEGKRKHVETAEASITILGTKNAEEFYSEDVYMNLKAVDDYSGLKTVTYYINDDKFVNKVEGKTLQHSWSKNRVKISAEKYEGKDISVVLEIEDNAGNIATVEETVKLDTTKPKISISYDNNNALNGNYYSQGRTATVTIKEYNFKNKDVEIIANQNGNSMNLEPDFKLQKKDYEEAGVLYKDYVMTIPFENDGDYDLTVKCADLAGNESSYNTVDEFIVDKTAPVVELTFNHNQPADGAFFKDGRTGTLTVTEHNFDASSMEIVVSRTLNGVQSTAPTPANFRSAGDKHVTSIAFSEEGVYTISVTGKDMAGNEANSISEQEFTIDVTPPEVVIEGLEAGVSYTGDVAPVITVTDNNYSREGVDISLTAGKQKTPKVDFKISQAVRGEVFRLNSFADNESTDDIYDLTVTATDLAGHETVKNLGFKINRYGSYYIVPDLSKQMIDDYYINGENDFEIYEYNVDGLTEQSVYYTLNGEQVQLKKDVDYTVKEEIDSDTEWSKYVYRISGSVFKQEGVYLLSISSKDDAGHVTDNKVKGLELEFCVDKTSPSCVVTGIEDGHSFHKDATRLITIDVFDNVEFDYFEILIDNVRKEKITANSLVNGKYNYTIPKDGGDHQLQIISYDVAGNQSQVVFDYHVDGALGSQQIMMILIIVFIVLIVAILILHLVFKKKRRKQ